MVDGAAAQGDIAPAVTPYRPSVSTPAALSAPGWVEVEAGFLNSRAIDPATRASLPYTFKLAFTPDWGIRVGGDAAVRLRGIDGSTRGGTGDTSVVLKRHFEVDAASSFGLELGIQAPTARAGIGSGHADQTLNGIYSSDFAANWHVDLNAWATRLGGADPGAAAWQRGWAAALSRSLSDRYGLVAELSGTRQRGSASTTQALIAASYAPAPAQTFDLGVSKGLTTATGRWSYFFGVTFLLAHLF
ncbi:MAG: transporter [Burkholderiales bacterium]|nr:transporter [Burkholderiales bacterium]MDE1927520.1 transporter [Burkholderiales bacterium]MDE2145444.1 transporter [Burkholderiales bacterium]MDE2501712.1 transporter [Burkholderiales bacterium]